MKYDSNSHVNYRKHETVLAQRILRIGSVAAAASGPGDVSVVDQGIQDHTSIFTNRTIVRR